jgi:very-short-patch-repair endonuclease
MICNSENPARWPVTETNVYDAVKLYTYMAILDNADRIFESDAEWILWHTWTAQERPLLLPQIPMGRYRADFMFRCAPVVIEVDGSRHGTWEHHKRDCRRDRDFARRGFYTFRYSADQLYNNAAMVVAEIEYLCNCGNAFHPLGWRTQLPGSPAPRALQTELTWINWPCSQNLEIASNGAMRFSQRGKLLGSEEQEKERLAGGKLLRQFAHLGDYYSYYANRH